MTPLEVAAATATVAPARRSIPFGALTIEYDERVLEPRPWTAGQSAWGAELLADAPAGPVLELCSGAGHIGLLTAFTTGRALVCVDLNPVACDFARANAAAAGLAGSVEVREGGIDEVVGPEERFVLVQADPPWVPRADTGRFPEDPLLAIDGGDDGLEVAWLCVAAAEAHLVVGGSALVQLGSTAQADALAAGLHRHPGLVAVEVREFERGVVLRLDRVQ